MKDLEEKIQELLKNQLIEFLEEGSSTEIKLTVSVSIKLEGEPNK